MCLVGFKLWGHFFLTKLKIHKIEADGTHWHIFIFPSASCKQTEPSTMTLSKASGNKSAIRSKESPKRAVSFCPSCKFDAPSKLHRSTDNELQSSDNRRRYMRRGSKSPSMLKILSSSELENEIKGNSTDDCGLPQRRLSLVSSLRLQLEKSVCLEPRVARKIRRMSIDKSRSFTFDVL